LLTRSDLRNLALMLAGFLGVILLISPARSFPVNDDWIYALSVSDLLNWRYTPPDWAQTTSLGHVAWGALFSTLFGYNFTVLTIATLVMSAGCLALFYLLLRHLDVKSDGALLVSALLGFNPIFFHLSYSFLTEVTFLAYTLAAVLCYLRGIKGYGEYWYWLGGLATSMAYLTRQFGILVVVAAFVYALAVEGWRWKWRQVIAIAALPVLTAIIYALWERTQPAQLIAFNVQTVIEGLVEDPLGYIQGRMMHITWTVSALGLYLLPALRMPRRSALALLFFVPLAFFLLRSGQIFGSLFPVSGNMVDHTGFEFGYYSAETTWSQSVWAILGVASAIVLSLHGAMCLERGWDWLRHARRSEQSRLADPLLLPCLLGLMLTLTVLFVTPSLYDRYWLPVLPFLLLPGLRPSKQSSDEDSSPRRIPVWRWLLLLPLAIFSMVGQRDYMEHAALRWQGAESLVAQGAQYSQVDAGFEWQGWNLFEEGARRQREKPLKKYIPFPPSLVLDSVYLVSDLPKTGYIEIGRLPYKSWLNGGHERFVRLLRRSP
jgi:4-amino-4-deoxy-L-arabinose transferase-like glycosyltransferase